MPTGRSPSPGRIRDRSPVRRQTAERGPGRTCRMPATGAATCGGVGRRASATWPAGSRSALGRSRDRSHPIPLPPRAGRGSGSAGATVGGRGRKAKCRNIGRLLRLIVPNLIVQSNPTSADAVVGSTSLVVCQASAVTGAAVFRAAGHIACHDEVRGESPRRRSFAQRRLSQPVPFDRNVNLDGNWFFCRFLVYSPLLVATMNGVRIRNPTCACRQAPAAFENARITPDDTTDNTLPSEARRQPAWSA